MKEAFLHYVWANQLFNSNELRTANNENIIIYSTGIFTGLDGPDFFNAKLMIDEQVWAGNVEIHKCASEWYAHNHEKDNRYNNVILHVVWDYDMPVFREDGTEIPVLILENYVDGKLVEKSSQLLLSKKPLKCGEFICEVDAFTWMSWRDRLFVERLEYKAKPIELLLEETNYHWEQVFFCFLARSFGLNSNGEVFFDAIRQLPVTVVYKQANLLIQIEALLFGVVGLLHTDDEVEDEYVRQLKSEWQFLKHKHNLKERPSGELQFFQLRPQNFPTIRLAQLASWYYNYQTLITQILESNNIDELYSYFNVEVSDYWKNHYVLNKESKKQAKRMTRSFIDLLIVNVILPMQIVYKRSKNIENYDLSEVIDIGMNINSEKNSIVSLFAKYNIKVRSIVDSQALVHLKKKYCDKGRCLECVVGKRFLKQ
ncbi:DUF2851 family protein [Myroides phaeus]|uniref:DUF2851 domain-containing protein n=1 Tax=Myroides phaeus TaxID=702745 RepID=A0A1G8BL00_9FLAO|nr:DUF2851 family protein [Myroides phaeus]SDH33896.1 Protein of unknown function [Myroides phaeus]